MSGLPRGGDDGDTKAKSTAFCKSNAGGKAVDLPSGQEMGHHVFRLIFLDRWPP